MNKIPVCIVSFNRALYLNSLLHSLSSELEEFEIIVADNNSSEKKFKEVVEEWKDRVTFLNLQGGDWINDEYKAKNSFLDHIRKNGLIENEYSLFLQDDMQYIGPKKFLKNKVENVKKENFLNVSLTGARRSTISSTYLEKIGNVWSSVDNHFFTTGLFKNEVFKNVGYYSQSYETRKEFWGRGEDDYNKRVQEFYGKKSKISCHGHVPLFVGVWNDPRGHYSFIRNNRRYGHYLPPVSPNKTYYRNLSEDEMNELSLRHHPLGFADVAHPIGWQYAKSLDGDQVKYPQEKIILEGPVGDLYE
jgi:glycosyltransferase involved in cell wall biosynthesis